MAIPEDLSIFSLKNLKLMVRHHGLESESTKPDIIYIDKDSDQDNQNIFEQMEQQERALLEKKLHDYRKSKEHQIKIGFGVLPGSDELIKSLHKNIPSSDDLFESDPDKDQIKIRYLKKKYTQKWGLIRKFLQYNN